MDLENKERKGVRVGNVDTKKKKTTKNGDLKNIKDEHRKEEKERKKEKEGERKKEQHRQTQIRPKNTSPLPHTHSFPL